MNEEKQRRKCLTGNEKRAAYVKLLQRNGGKDRLESGLIAEICEEYGIGRTAAKEIWQKGRLGNFDDTAELLSSFSPQRKKKCGRKKKELPVEQIKALPMEKRRTVRSLSKALGIPPTTLQDKIKSKNLLRHTNPLRPKHTELNLLQRLKHCVSLVSPASVDDTPEFCGMYNYIHLDEKWFNIMEDSSTMIIVPGETPPHRTCKHKRFLGKIMFLSAIARPRFSEGECTFDGKIGIFPFVKEEPAERSSANRPRGTLILKPVNVTREVYADYLGSHLIPAIFGNFPAEDLGEPIILQQDNARPHILPDDEQFLQACATEGLNVSIINQPPNSPDFNVNDLGFFRALDACRSEELSKNLRELVQNVEQAFNDFDAEKLDNLWLSYQACMVETMKVGGRNSYKLPHLGKTALRRQGLLPKNLSFPIELLESTNRLIAEKTAALNLA